MGHFAVTELQCVYLLRVLGGHMEMTICIHCAHRPAAPVSLGAQKYSFTYPLIIVATFKSYRINTLEQNHILSIRMHYIHFNALRYSSYMCSRYNLYKRLLWNGQNTRGKPLTTSDCRKQGSKLVLSSKCLDYIRFLFVSFCNQHCS